MKLNDSIVYCTYIRKEKTLQTYLLKTTALYSRTAWLMNQSECPPLDSLTSFLARSLMQTLSVNGSLDSMPDSVSLNLERYSMEFGIDKIDIIYRTE